MYAAQEGFVSAIDTRALGMAVVEMGGGRRRASDTINYSVGLDELTALGERVDAHRPLATIHAQDEASWQAAARAVNAAITLSDTPPQPCDVVYRKVEPAAG